MDATTALGFVPAEAALHASTIMTWPTMESLEGVSVTATRAEIRDIAQAIAKYEPVEMFVSDSDESRDSAATLLNGTEFITIHETSHVDSLWARDTGPISVRLPAGDTAGVILNFNEWGAKTPVSPDEAAACTMLSTLHLPELQPRTCLHAEGGALEHDGSGTLLATESSLLNDNRNPGWTRAELEREFARLFGVRKTLWLAGRAGDDITDEHVDGIARFGAPGTVLLHRPHAGNASDEWDIYADARARLAGATDAAGRALRVVDVEGPDARVANLTDDAAALNYVNFYVANGVVVLPRFGDEAADEAALRVVRDQFRGRVVEQVYLHEIALGGGGIHCATQQVLAPEEEDALRHI